MMHKRTRSFLALARITRIYGIVCIRVTYSHSNMRIYLRTERRTKVPNQKAKGVPRAR